MAVISMMIDDDKEDIGLFHEDIRSLNLMLGFPYAYRQAGGVAPRPSRGFHSDCIRYSALSKLKMGAIWCVPKASLAPGSPSVGRHAPENRPGIWIRARSGRGEQCSY